MSAAQPKARRRFPGLDSTVLQHPYDRAALNALQKVPGLDIIVRKFIELYPERVAYIQNVAQTVRVTMTQCPQLYVQLREACAILDMRVPEFYVAQIILTSGLLDLMNEDEVMAVIAHELGHIKSGHVLYRTMALCISLVLTLISDMTLGVGRLVGRSLEAALLEWYRMSEFTGDRAALLVVQDSQVMLSLMMKFAGGTLFQRNQLDDSEFLKQAELYEAVDANLLDRIYKMLLVVPVAHPLTIVRAREIMNWSESREYKDILDGRYSRTRADTHSGTRSEDRNKNNPSSSSPDTKLTRCPHCGREQTNRRFCSLCDKTIM